MKRIRIGKDISMRWEITTDGVAIPLEGRDLTIEIKSPAGIVNNIPYRVEGNILIMTFYGYEQKRTGEYSITLWENKGKIGQNVVDVIRAFELVRTSQEEDDFVGGDLQIESVDLGTENFDILTEGGYRAINIDTLQAEALEDAVNINGKTYSNESFTITLPKANLDSAGVMSADDKQTLQEHGNRIAQIKTSCEENAADIERVSNVVDTHESRLGGIDAEISSLNTEASTLHRKVDANTTSISQINNNIAGHEESISQINTKLEEHTESINAKITTDRIEDGAVTSDKISTSAFDDTLSVSGKIAPADVVGKNLANLGKQVIYDITANNDGATFASLSALLSSENLSTLIPYSVRRGGMSIRFVQSSDNKYVQYRLMSDLFNNTPANWQGVDDVPTIGSENIVKSGGVYDILNKIDATSLEAIEVNETNIYSLTTANTYYKLVKNITLSQDITIPEGSIFDFNGYKIGNSINYNIVSPNNNNPVYLKFNNSAKFQLQVYLSGTFRLLEPTLLSNIVNITHQSHLNYFWNFIQGVEYSTIIVDTHLSISSPLANTAVLKNGVTIIGLFKDCNIRFNAALTLGDNCRFKNLTIVTNYPAYRMTLGKNCVIDNCIIHKIIDIPKESEYCVVKNSDIINTENRGCIIVRANHTTIKNNHITTDRKDISLHSINISASYCTIENNYIDGTSTVCIMLHPSLDNPIISNNIIRGNNTKGCSEENISFDQYGAVYKNNCYFVGFYNEEGTEKANGINPKKIYVRFNESAEDYKSYVGFIIQGISDNTLGMFSEITEIEQDTIDTTRYIVTLKDSIFTEDTIDGKIIYHFKDGENKGYPSYENTLFSIGSVFVNNIVENNTLYGGCLDIYGSALCNVFRNNTQFGSTDLAVYMINNSPSKYMDKVKILPICNNMIINCMVPNGGIMFHSSGSFGTTDVTDINKNKYISETYIAYNIVKDNISKYVRLYNSKDCILSTGISKINWSNPPYGYNSYPFKGKNLRIPVTFIDKSNCDDISSFIKRGEVVIIKTPMYNGDTIVDYKYQIYDGENNGSNNTNPIIRDL